MLRHTLATLAYRAEKAVRGVPPEFPGARLSDASRTPLEILGHMCDLMAWGERMARGVYHWEPGQPVTWDETVDRFFGLVAAFDTALAESPAESLKAEIMFQGPIADALTHVGQLSMIRGTIGAAVRPESYARADIAVGRVSRNQSATRSEFDGDASKPRLR
jgi:hypothetical protein